MGTEEVLPPSARPTCLWCGKRLRPHWRYDFSVDRSNPTRTLDGYGGYGDSYFCGLSHGFRWGVERARLIGFSVPPVGGAL